MNQPLGNAWERRGEHGFVKGLIGGLKDFVTQPGQTYEQTRRSGDLLSPLLYAVILGVVAQALGLVWKMLFGRNWMQYLPPEAREQMDSWGVLGATSAGGGLVWLIFAPLFIVVVLFIWAAILHLCLLVVGGLKDSEAGFEGTLRSVSYAQTASLAQVIPLIGGLVAFVWMMVLTVIGFIRLHRTSEGKAIVGVVLPLLLCCVCVVVAIGFGIAGVAAAFSN